MKLRTLAIIFSLIGAGSAAACETVEVYGNHNQVTCVEGGVVINGQYYPTQPQYQPQYQPPMAAPACVTPGGNFPMMVAMPYYQTCQVPVHGGYYIGWTGNVSDNFYYPPF